MDYPNMTKAVFLSRPNRFIARILVEGREETAHVKNTGRCKELLVPGARLYVQRFAPSIRKTNYDVIAVYKGERLINLDSQAPNKLFAQWVAEGHLFRDVTLWKPETTHGNSRFDFYVEAAGKRSFVEVKGVTLEQDGVVFFPDAPTLRGLKHMRELCACVGEGYGAYLILMVQMRGVLGFRPNDQTQPAFGEALREAKKQGVVLLALDCDVNKDSISPREEVPIWLEPQA